MVVEDLDLRIMGIGYTKGITLLDKGFRRLGKGRVRVFDEINGAPYQILGGKSYNRLYPTFLSD